MGIRYKNRNIKTNLTSPDIITLHKNLEKLKKNKIDNVIIEASSHGLDQNRLDYLNLKAGIFTNLRKLKNFCQNERLSIQTLQEELHK